MIDFFAAKPKKKNSIDRLRSSIEKNTCTLRCIHCSCLCNVSTISTQDVKDLVRTAEIVIFSVPPTVNTTHVTFRMEPVLGVSLDGLGYIATQV